jgi:hypothetical protein
VSALEHLGLRRCRVDCTLTGAVIKRLNRCDFTAT